MLFDPKRQKPDPFLLESLIAWLEKQPADKVYSDTNPAECLFAQYLGCQAPALLSDEFGLDVARIAYDEPKRFGAALDRARALVNRSPYAGS